MTNEELVLLHQQGDKRALESLINNNMGIVIKIASKYNNINSMLELDDLLQVGYIGLITAANKYKFDIEHPTEFITFAFIIIKQEILSCVNGRSSKDIGNNRFYNNCKRLNTKIGEEEETELLETIDSQDESIDNIEEQLYIKQLRNELEKVMVQANTLKEREILKLHYGWDTEPVVSTEIGEIFNIDSNKVRQIEAIALRKIRNSVWCRTTGKKYRDEIIGSYAFTYTSVEKKFDDELRNLYAM
ncbi:sigma-70 family RNA polymerase sigma factor [Clostridium botulinum]|nr:RNA polymerase sigma factor, sigma-70 family protein [Clostridium botulinum]MBY6805163.1 sigma-70 family RNA polymerase sigma factor [Clostridium botulinum]MBY6815180.1 sigma-70 family RNA polymerase sigma factor [Clostridium botulinum]MBY6821792.1 sigma-70 family RNA polymerase sigma factor [Clostridium botulinum]NFJ52309.1 sigma-70 family RNA polymerase sigma factor [Clostridium botulinum]